MNTDAIIHDTIQADQIEDGDQILVDGDHLENVRVDSDPEDIDAVVVTGYSFDSGDAVTYTLPYDYDVQVWSL
jgi:hypothetical protein